MSKRRYHCVDCKRVDWSALGAQVAGARTVFAVDVAKNAFVAAVQSEPERTLLRVKWRHPQQSGELLAGLEALVAAGAKLEVVMESSGVYGDALRWQFEQRGMAVYRVSAKHVHDSAEIYDSVPSVHDAKACELIAKLHWEGRSRAWAVATPERRALLACTCQLAWLKDRAQRERNRFEALLARHWPEAETLLGLGSVALLRLLATYGSPAQIAALAPQAGALLRESGGAFLAQEKIELLIASAEHTLGMPCIAEERVLLRHQAEEVLNANRAVHAAERALVKAVPAARAATPLNKVLGPVTGAVLLATQGNPEDYPSAESYCKGFGLNLKERSSGKHKGQLKITKRGPATARFYLYFAALRLLRRDPVIKQWYAAKTARAGAVKRKTVIELMRKLAKAAWHQAHGRDFDVNRLVNLKAVGTQ